MKTQPLNPKIPYGLVFTGGGTRGCYEIGAWKALKELNVKITAVAGTSIGAINGAFFVQDDFDLAYKTWTSIKIDDFIVAEDDNPIKIFISALKDKGLDVTPLKKMLNRYFDEALIRQSPVDYGLVTFSLSDVEPVMVLKKDIPDGQLVDYILASASFPLFKPAVINGKRYLDGAVYDNVPVPLLKKAGCQDIIVVNISGVGIDRNYTAEKVGIRSLHTIQNSSELCGTLEFDLDKINKGIDMGYLDTLKAFGKVYGKKYYFSEPISDFEKYKHLHPLTENDLASLLNVLTKDSEDSSNGNKYPIIKRLYEYGDGQLSPQNILLASMEITAEIFELPRIKLYHPEELYEAIVIDYLNTLDTLQTIESKKTLLDIYKSLDFNNINKKTLTTYFISLTEKDKVSKKFLVKFLPKVYIAYLFLSFMKNRDVRLNHEVTN
jgi:NTE family protein